ncbi:MAG TPA: DUF4129 domain-containing protein [Candidatus Limnocylindria bacterium]|nr:DUF4129 domain-containing protein [Candidatus Limnocylindria bacterium]
MFEQRHSPTADPEAVGPGATGRPISAWVAVPTAAGLIAIVALASRSTTATPGPGRIDLTPALTAIETLGYVGLAVGTAALVLTLVLSRGRPRRRHRGGPAIRKQLAPVPWWANVLGLVVVLGMLAVQVAITLSFLAELQRRAAEAAGAGEPGPIFGLDPGTLQPAGKDLTSLTIALVIVTVLVVVLVGYAIRLRLRDDRLDDVGGGGHAATANAVEVSLEALRGEPDPRRAVIAAYAAMERSLSRAGFGRRRSEAPLEYLRRVLAAPTRAADELLTITLLFQHAKFSRHAVDEEMRNGAIDALERIRTAASEPA